MMKSYLNNPKATEATIKDGWLYTGDIGKYLLHFDTCIYIIASYSYGKTLNGASFVKARKTSALQA